MVRKKQNSKILDFKNKSTLVVLKNRPTYQNIISILIGLLLTSTVIYILIEYIPTDNLAVKATNKNASIVICESSKHTPLNSSYDLANHYNKNQDFRRAEDCYKVSIKSSMQTRNYIQLFDSQVQLGLIMESKENPELALSYIEQAFQTQKKYLPGDGDAFFYATHMKSSILLGSDKFREALKLQLQVADYLESKERKKSRLYGSVQLDMGITYTFLGLWGKAKNSLQKAKYILLSNENLSEIARFWNAYGVLALKLEDGNTAVDRLKKTLSIRTKLFPKRKYDIANTLTNIGTAYETSGNCKEAITNFQQAEKIYISLYGKNGIQLLVLKNNIGICYKKLGSYSVSKQYFESLLQISQSGLKESNLITAKIHANLGVVLLRLLERKKACYHLKIALNLHQDMLGENHSETISIRDKAKHCR